MLEALSALLALILTLLLMPGFIRYMKERGFIQPVYDLGPDSFKKKEKPPNMGGLVIAVAVVMPALLAGVLGGSAGTVLLLMIPSLGMLLIGLADDWIKDSRKEHEGLKPRHKIIGQTGVGLLFAVLCATVTGTAIHLPFTKAVWELSWAYYPLMTLLFVFMTNSANIQDGVDGLMASVTLAGSGALGAIAVVIAGGPAGDGGVAAACFALCCACLGFLFFNQHPARIYLGDTGSMFIGGLLTGAAMLLRLQLWLVPLCFTMIASSASVILQRVYYKLTGGRRLFLMSPVHHHFEKLGWTEAAIARRYTLVVLALSAVAAFAALPIAP
ncbi:MAG TPA: phospho-N-acetylmuramoyl-pentapeptide-transferase [Candidatus Limnocylindria bacterium]|nr:phospho-N-acetylmuramoyl-pentapeptide-transferase [Candidatus Limnocylindria bacterium]